MKKLNYNHSLSEALDQEVSWRLANKTSYLKGHSGAELHVLLYDFCTIMLEFYLH